MSNNEIKGKAYMDSKYGEDWFDVSIIQEELGILLTNKEKLYTKREFELAYCFGVMNREATTVDLMAKQLEQWEKVKSEIQKIVSKPPIDPIDLEQYKKIEKEFGS